ncbi:hypothetical protein QTH90_24750 [Variovorax sp. J2P1-59]|uniref:DUF1176 domain-containing protein n=1 Tax=Variovorax flavidus TaxID=3053501 RepID=UPI0025759E59|nr:DUF1176 domain-containing protein [Variovorax sp. J2P1-59]MDM0077640.1 hypothetical protein [Variovorax sp. J2P1-59]
MASSAPVHAAGEVTALRRTIEIREFQCNELALVRYGELAFVRACAKALNSLPVADYADVCNDMASGAANLYQWVTLLWKRNWSRQAVFHPWQRGRFLLEVPCGSGAYNLSSIFFDYDERKLPATIAAIRFPHPDGSSRFDIYNRGRGPQRGQLVEWAQARGMGDAGYYARYNLDKETLRPTLVEAMEKTAWDGKDPFQWDGRLSHKPRGTSWQRVYPTGATPSRR